MEQNNIIGTYRRFGDAGVVYQILDMLSDDTVKIRVLETDEETSYPLSKVLTDPTEH